MKNSKEIGEKIQQRRKLLGMTQTELAERTGYLQSTISHIERGYIVASMDQVIKIFEVLEMKFKVL